MRRPTNRTAGDFRNDLMRMFGRPSKRLLWFMGILAGVFLVFLFGGADFIIHYLVLRPRDVLHGQVWKLFSYMFVHTTPQSLLMNLLGLWMLGSALENEWGTRRLLVFLGITGGAAGLAIVGMAALLGPAQLGTGYVGLASAVAALIVGFGCMFPNTPIYVLGLVPIAGKYLAMGLAALILLSGIAEKAYVSTVGYAVAMGLGALLVTGLWRPSLLLGKLRKTAYQRRLKVLEGGRDRNRYLN